MVVEMCRGYVSKWSNKVQYRLLLGAFSILEAALCQTHVDEFCPSPSSSPCAEGLYPWWASAKICFSLMKEEHTYLLCLDVLRPSMVNVTNAFFHRERTLCHLDPLDMLFSRSETPFGYN